MLPDLKLFQLPAFEGQKVWAGRLKLTGSASTAVRPLQIGDEFIAVVKCRVVGVDHTELTETKTTFLARVHKLQVSEAHELADGEQVLEQGRKWSRAVADVQQGTSPLWDDDDPRSDLE